MTSETEEKIRATNRETKGPPQQQQGRDSNNSKNHDLQFRVFSIMFACSLVLDLVEDWIDHTLNYTALVLFYVFVLSTDGQKRWSYPLFLVVVMAYHLFVDFPGVPNHINVAIVICVQQLMVVLYLWYKNSSKQLPSPGQVFQLLRPIVGLTVIIIYFCAGFHKLNWDFLHPRTGCTANFLKQRMGVNVEMFRWNWKWPFELGHANSSSNVTLADIRREHIATQKAAWLAMDRFVTSASIMTLVWEMVGGLALFFEQSQPAMLVFSLMMHLQLCPLSFYDFTSMVLSFFVAFLPDSYFSIYTDNQFLVFHVPLYNVKQGKGTYYKLQIDRLTVYAACPAVVAYFTKTMGSTQDIQKYMGMIYIAFFGVLLQPIATRMIKSASRSIRSSSSTTKPNDKLPPWTKPFDYNIKPRWMMLTHAVLIFLGVSNYLGLRTGGTFSMFSNLQTEGDTSNHILLGSNPFKIWDYQEDMVIIRSASRNARIRGRPDGYGVPLVEFQRKMAMWRDPQRKSPVAMTFEYRGTVYKTENVGTLDEDFILDVNQLGWSHYFMTFRKIQLDNKPVQCRW